MYIEWCMGMSIILSALAIMIAATKNDTDGSGGIVIMLISAGAMILLVVGLVTFREPQFIKEQAVKVGVGKFLADEKGHVNFYFVKPDGTLIEYKKIE